jgi:hypothetical protein
MAITVGIVGQTGHGKSTSIAINPDGKCFFLRDDNPNKADKYEGIDPLSTVIIASDRKALPFPCKGYWEKNKNLFRTSDTKTIMQLFEKINAGTNIKRVIIDTVGGVMLDHEMVNMKTPGYNKWTDLAMQIYELITYCNDSLREDIVVYLMAHVATFDDIDGITSRRIATNGRKLEKIFLESKLPIVLYATVEQVGSNNEYFFETTANRSTAKTPLGMFNENKIPNSLSLVDTRIREYYEIPV